MKKSHVRIKDVMERTKQKNTYRYPTASITNSEFWGMPLGKKLWGENFVSVTSQDNVEYSVVNKNEISFNPARANIGSFGINLSDQSLAVTSAYPVYKIKPQKKDEFLPEYIYLQIRHNPEVKEDIAERAYGTIRQSLSKDEFEKVQIPKESLEKQNEIVKEVQSKYEKYLKLKEQLNNFEM
ncbi:restriction endonuclease subunit S [Staphylococcus pettenkoferi]|uniref:restriction endonuclease subunit S n=2 Tax=Staphylococcus pettenkoferi TaxID=170573 RepID=UPI000B51DD6B|nr:restriction endonuclease subunit S [Staphylococcus pettenkoferi]ASE37321.1 hypothetical protein CEP67_08480 [Staphylococcus pettenkoferi]MCY1580969.1 restriction endonuclease subunit S [Staphylococcus pettenkoferi]MCY1619382.1 restriction endonuclease subunit S [Staphylococcus pettenkoferi]